MKSKPGLITVYGLSILVATVSFLFSPEPLSMEGFHGNYIHINKKMGFTVNGDSYAFCQVAEEPSRLLIKNEKRQSRPLYALLGSAFSIPVKGMIALTGFQPGSGNETEIKEGGRAVIPVFAGYIIINALALLFSLLLFDFLLRRTGINQAVIFLLIPFMLFNEPVKTFFWTAHQQIFNILSPLCCIWLLDKISNSRNRISFIKFSLLSFLSGILLLLYGNFLLLLPVIIAGIWLKARFSSQRISVVAVLNVVFFFLLPTLLWIMFLNVFASGYYSHELTSYRQLVWITDELQKGILPFLNRWIINTRIFMSSLHIPVLFIIIAFALNLKKKIRLPVSRLSLKMAAFIIFILFFLFHWALGFYASRLSFALVPPLLVIIALSMDHRFIISPYRYISFSVVLIWIVYQVASYGPFY